MSDFIKIETPISKDKCLSLKAGDRVLLSGVIYTGRDAAHKRIFEALQKGESLPMEIEGQVIYYVGPCFSNGKPISAGPTTSMRMDRYAPALYDAGLAASIGKGDRSEEVYAAIKKNGGLYLAAIGGAGSVYADCVKKSSLVAFAELGTEAIYRFEVENFPLIVAIDGEGNSIYHR